ncbi:GFA family protein [Candidatus Neomarinimicrobiota bacterium]
MITNGSCACGSIKYQIEGELSKATHCHCNHCRQTSGAPFITWIEVKSSDFKLLQGEPGSFESRENVARQFCTQCGTQLTYQHAKRLDYVDVTVGSLNDPGAVVPNQHIWCDRMLDWLELNDGLPQYGMNRT